MIALLQDRVGDRRTSAAPRRRAPSAPAPKWFSPIQAVANGTSDSQNSRCRFAHRTPPLIRVGRVQHVVVIVPVDAEVDEAQHVAQEHRQQSAAARASPRRAALSSSTMIVMMIAITPSLNASSRPLVIGGAPDRSRSPARRSSPGADLDDLHGRHRSGRRRSRGLRDAGAARRAPSVRIRGVLVTRILAYAREFREGIAFSAGLSDPDEPTISVRDLTGRSSRGSTSVFPTRRACTRRRKRRRGSPSTRIKIPAQLVQRLAGERIHRADALELYAIDRRPDRGAGRAARTPPRLRPVDQRRRPLRVDRHRYADRRDRAAPYRLNMVRIRYLAGSCGVAGRPHRRRAVGRAGPCRPGRHSRRLRHDCQRRHRRRHRRRDARRARAHSATIAALRYSALAAALVVGLVFARLS